MQVKNSLRELSPLAKSLVLFIIILFGVVISSGLLMGLNLVLWHYPIDFMNSISAESSLDMILAGKISQIISHLGIFIIPAFVFAYLTSFSVKKGLFFSRTLSVKNVGVVVLVTLLAIPFINLLAEWNSILHFPTFMEGVEEWMRKMQKLNDGVLGAFLPMNTSMDIAINVLMMAIIPAVGEELIFRGVLQTQLTKGLKNPHVAIVLTAILFSAFHLQFLGFFSRALLGVLFGYLFYWSKNMWLPIIAHFVNNSLALVLVLIYGSETAMNTEGEFLTWQFGLASLVLFVLGVIVLVKQRSSLQLE